MVPTDLVGFCGYPFFWLFTDYKIKEGEHIHDRLFVPLSVSFYECLFAREKKRSSFTTRMEFPNGMKLFFFRESRECISVD